MTSLEVEKKQNTVTIGLWVFDKPGVMLKIMGLFARRGYNIASISVGHSEREGFSRMTIIAEGETKIIEQIIKQLNKLTDVIKVQALPSGSTTIRELGLIKIAIRNNSDRINVEPLVNFYKAKVIDVNSKTMTIEVVGTEQKLDSFIALVSEIVSIKEIVRSGVVGLSRGEDSINMD
jgi:acetolactate synthase I/III small subunit